MSAENRTKRHVLAALTAALLCGTIPAAAAEGPKGPLLIAGGEFGFANPGWQRFVELAGGAGAAVLVIPTASGDPDGNGERMVQHLRGLGAAAELVPLTAENHAPARDPAWVAKVEAAGGIWFIGGDQAKITAALVQADGTDTPLLAAMRRANGKGAIIGGSSAGAAIMSARMFKEGPEPLDALRDGLVTGRHTDRGLGFIGDGWFVDQHFLARGRIGRMVVAQRDLDYRFGVGVEEDTAILVRDGMAEVVGNKGVILTDMEGADIGPGAPVTLGNVEISFAAPGDRFALADGTVTPAEIRAKGRIDPNAPDFDPYYGETPFWTADILGPGVLVGAMARTLDSKAGKAGGLAFGPRPEGAARNIGFTLDLRRNAASHGWYASGGGGYTVVNLRLDIRPVEMADPLYRPLSP